jgi:hypothetical protein
LGILELGMLSNIVAEAGDFMTALLNERRLK